jgi:hypothetical protein
VSEDRDQSSSPGAVTAAVAASVAPLPFLAVYATLFIARGAFRPVNPPDITTTPHGELAAGIIAFALLIVGTLSTFWFLSGKRRWLFVLAQAATLGTAIDFVADSTSGPPGIPILLIATSALALVLAFTPASSAHMRVNRPRRLDPTRRAAERAAERAASEV